MSGRPTGLARDVGVVARGFRWGRRPPLPRDVLAVAPLPEATEFPTDWSRTTAARAAREVVQTAFFGPLVRSQTRPVVSGLDRLEAVQGPCVLAANHSSHLDAPLVVLSLPPEVRRWTAVTAAADYFFDSWWRAAGTAVLLGTVPMERSTGRSSPTAARLLDEGWNLLVFPEGTRSPDGTPGPMRSGAARLAAAAGVPLVPVSLQGTWAAMPRGRGWPVPGRPPVEVRFGRPLDTVGRDPRALTDELRAALVRLHDESRGDWYRSLRDAATGSSGAVAGPTATSESAAPLPGWRRRFEAGRPRATSSPRRVRVWHD